MRVARVLDGLIVELDELTVLFPNTSFTELGPNDEFLVENNLMRVVDDITFDNKTQKIVEVSPYVLMGAVYTRMAVLLTLEELETRNTEAWYGIRVRRNQLLRECDYTVGRDSPYAEEQIAVWMAYREELRNLPQTQIDPLCIVWPSKPFTT
jgi:hypothetical protein